MAEYEWSPTGNNHIEVTKKGKNSGVSYDFMDKLNELVDKGIFVDDGQYTDDDGTIFSNQDKKNLGQEFDTLHTETGRATNFTSMNAGTSFDYTDPEFIRLAKAAGYVLKEDNQVPKTKIPVVEEIPATQKEQKPNAVPDDQASGTPHKHGSATLEEEGDEPISASGKQTVSDIVKSAGLPDGNYEIDFNGEKMEADGAVLSENARVTITNTATGETKKYIYQNNAFVEDKSDLPSTDPYNASNVDVVVEGEKIVDANGNVISKTQTTVVNGQVDDSNPLGDQVVKAGENSVADGSVAPTTVTEVKPAAVTTVTKDESSSTPTGSPEAEKEKTQTPDEILNDYSNQIRSKQNEINNLKNKKSFLGIGKSKRLETINAKEQELVELQQKQTSYNLYVKTHAVDYDAWDDPTHEYGSDASWNTVTSENGLTHHELDKSYPGYRKVMTQDGQKLTAVSVDEKDSEGRYTKVTKYYEPTTVLRGLDDSGNDYIIVPDMTKEVVNPNLK